MIILKTIPSEGPGLYWKFERCYRKDMTYKGTWCRHDICLDDSRRSMLRRLLALHHSYMAVPQPWGTPGVVRPEETPMIFLYVVGWHGLFGRWLGRVLWLEAGIWQKLCRSLDGFRFPFLEALFESPSSGFSSIARLHVWCRSLWVAVLMRWRFCWWRQLRRCFHAIEGDSPSPRSSNLL
jgi:hypothetical protein